MDGDDDARREAISRHFINSIAHWLFMSCRSASWTRPRSSMNSTTLVACGNRANEPRQYTSESIHMTQLKPCWCYYSAQATQYRSQMAEAILNHDLAGRVRALSAGTVPQARVKPGARSPRSNTRTADRRAPSKGRRRGHRRADRSGGDGVRQREGKLPIFPRPVARIHRLTIRTASRWKASSACVTKSRPRCRGARSA